MNLKYSNQIKILLIVVWRQWIVEMFLKVRGKHSSKEMFDIIRAIPNYHNLCILMHKTVKHPEHIVNSISLQKIEVLLRTT